MTDEAATEADNDKRPRVIDATPSPETEAIGEIEGRLQYTSIHGDRNAFRIYPAVGRGSVACLFPPDKLEDARNALDRRIRVSGKLTYPAGSDFPKSIRVDSIKRLPSDDELPGLMDLRGIAPNLTGNLSSEEFVRGLRNAD